VIIKNAIMAVYFISVKIYSVETSKSLIWHKY